MAELHSVSANCNTFRHLAEMYMSKLLHCFKNAHSVVDVFDQYDYENSVKAEERNLCLAAASDARQYEVIAGHPLPLWQKFISLSSNKTSLTDFLCKYVTEHAPITPEFVNQPQHKIYLAGGFRDGEITMCITSHGVQPIHALYSSQEESDTRMLFHTLHAYKDFESQNIQGSITIRSPNTDVLILAIHYFPALHDTKHGFKLAK